MSRAQGAYIQQLLSDLQRSPSEAPEDVHGPHQASLKTLALKGTALCQKARAELTRPTTASGGLCSEFWFSPSWLGPAAPVQLF